ncbi:hypothetical protein [Haladaptatus cibarius]|uniref:hypothetical protein n=1 Tax=Haladaptatus cibarius TaxID=453847 RepID=UPI000678CF04|nr:hypothetical protein [Haladaptatus cibarius]
MTLAPASAAAERSNLATTQRFDLTRSEQDAFLRDYRDADIVKAAVQQQSDVLEELSDDGVIEEAKIGDLHELTDPTGRIEGERLTANQLGDSHTPRILIIRRVEDGYLSLSVFPEEDTAHAILNPVEDGEPLGEDHLVRYGSLPEPEVDCDSSLGLCETCDCETVCCERHPDDNSCIAVCDECDCYCECCDCSDNSCVYEC